MDFVENILFTFDRTDFVRRFEYNHEVLIDQNDIVEIVCVVLSLSYGFEIKSTSKRKCQHLKPHKHIHTWTDEGRSRFVFFVFFFLIKPYNMLIFTVHTSFTLALSVAFQLPIDSFLFLHFIIHRNEISHHSQIHSSMCATNLECWANVHYILNDLWRCSVMSVSLTTKSAQSAPHCVMPACILSFSNGQNIHTKTFQIANFAFFFFFFRVSQVTKFHPKSLGVSSLSSHTALFNKLQHVRKLKSFVWIWCSRI